MCVVILRLTWCHSYPKPTQNPSRKGIDEKKKLRKNEETFRKNVLKSFASTKFLFDLQKMWIELIGIICCKKKKKFATLIASFLSGTLQSVFLKLKYLAFARAVKDDEFALSMYVPRKARLSLPYLPKYSLLYLTSIIAYDSFVCYR